MTNNKKLIICGAVCLTAIILLILVLTVPIWDQPVSAPLPANGPENGKVTVRIKAVGDNLIHSPIFKSCKTEDGYNFDRSYENIAGYISDADIAVVNQETIFVPEESGYSGYPSFGTPHQTGESLEKAGFNVVTHATNHTYDRGTAGVNYTMDFWKQYDNITVLGINDSPEKQQRVDLWQKGDLSIAMLNFTYGLNGYRLPEDKPYLVNLLQLGEFEENLLLQAEESADITVVFVHFGTEYVHTPTKEQVETVEFLCQNGADIIIGTHPHVVQPMARHISENGNEAIVYYSLGNFFSNQEGAAKILGAMADITITKENGKVMIENYEMHPLVTHCSDRKYSVYMLEDYNDELAQKHSRARGLSMEKLNNLYNEIISIEVK